MLLKNEWVHNEIKEGIKNYLETNENEHNPRFMGHNESSPETEGHNSTGLCQEARKISNNVMPKRPRKITTKPRVSRRKEIIKIRVEINDIESRKNTKDQWNKELVL